MDVQVEHRQDHGEVRLVVRGEVDASRCGQLEETFRELLDAGRRSLVVDARNVEFLDSSGLRVLLAAEERCRVDGGELRIDAPSDAVRYVLELTDLEGRFGLED